MPLGGGVWESSSPADGCMYSEWVGPGLAANGAPAAEKPDEEAGSHGQLVSDLLVLPQKPLPWDLFLINNH